MKDEAKEAKIETFWNWFMQTETSIRAYFSEEEDGIVDKKALIESINNNVLDFGLIAWEIGPGQNKPFHFTISPNGNKDLLRRNKALMRAAPELEDWEFNPAKPVRADRLQFSLYDNYMIEQSVDASGWQSVLLKKADQSIALLLEANTIATLDEDTQLTAGQMVVINLLGEEAKINHVSKIEVVVELEEIYQANSFPVAELSERFWQLVKNRR
ncbi:MAG: hypothetical protein DHS20C18_46360 [Saprospiraceae bacterium]|nr:MAG: hypothetical protein DHS20C18_46360 [Saprospiraceae bacterium]